jgi:hypothetical protein
MAAIPINYETIGDDVTQPTIARRGRLHTAAP